MIWAAVLAYFVVQLGIGWWASRRVGGEVDYLVAGRRLGLWMVAGSLFATWFGAETVMGSSSAIAEAGLSGGRADPFGYTVCLLGMAILIAFKMRDRGYVTLGDFFRDRYGRTVELLAVVIMVPTSVMWAAAQLLAFGEVIVVVSDISLEFALLASLTMVVAYTVLGGLLSDVVTDLFQGVVVVIGLLILFAFVVANAGGVGEAFSGISADQLSLIGEDEGFFSAMNSWMIPIVGSLVAQEAISRFLGAKSASTARNAGFVAAGLYFVFAMIPALIGLIVGNMDLNLAYDDAFLPTLAEELMPPALFVIFIGALISAILSTVDTTLLAVSGLVTRNIIDPLTPAATDRQRLAIARLVTAIAGIFAYVLATGGDTIYGLVEAASSWGSAGIAVTVLIGLWSGFGGPRAALAALIAGVAGTIFFGAYHEDVDFLLTLILSTVVFVAVAMVERRAAQPA